MPPEQQQDSVWISREEYERLRQAQQTVPAQPVIYGQTDYPVDEPAKVKPIQVAVGTVLAIGLFLSLTVPFFKFISAPILLALLIFAAMSFNDFRRAKRQVNGTAQSSMDTVAIANQGKGSGKYHALLVVLLCILAAPVVLIGGIIILLIFAAHGSGGQSS
jgi:hypothetical protein